MKLNGNNILGYMKGDSAYQIAVNNGYVGTEEQWLESLKVKGDAYIITEDDKYEIAEIVKDDCLDDLSNFIDNLGK